MLRGGEPAHPLAVQGLLDELMAKVGADGLALTGEGGFLPEFVKAVAERGLAISWNRGDFS